MEEDGGETFPEVVTILLICQDWVEGVLSDTVGYIKEIILLVWLTYFLENILYHPEKLAYGVWKNDLQAQHF
jgi:hypothetical protein